MKSALVSCLLCQVLFIPFFISSALAENTIQVSPHEGNKLTTVKNFISKDNAEKFAEKLKSEGFEVEIREVLTKDNELIYRVSGKKQTEALKETLSPIGEKGNEKLSTEQISEIQKEKIGPLIIFSPRERTEFRNVDKVTFLWRKVPHVVQYHIILAKDRKLTDIIYEDTNVTGTSYTIDGLNYGTYFFRILSRLSDNTKGPTSETLSFVIVPPKPSKLPLYFLE